ncbi:MAG: tRNA epoxyqueuosine(34) reductase QueG [Candidatus Delongbacteria bacterium]|nr:tRNA epoxyqueuosine(34) reductase QueG [Candidatus Delongbacteria bacterium]
MIRRIPTTSPSCWPISNSSDLVAPTTAPNKLTREYLLARAGELGADLVGITDTSPLDQEGTYLHSWLADGCQAGMSWISRQLDKRLLQLSPFPTARSILVIAVNYFTGPDTADPVYGISRYGRGRDYHKVVGSILKELANLIETRTGCQSRWFVDAGPVLEKALAQRAGLGWIGRNKLLINRDRGSWFFLGELFTELELEPDQPHTALCGDCTLCLEACPTGALNEAGQLDSRLCISYQTIERPAAELCQPPLSGNIFGCDICQEVCPWNRKPLITTLVDFQLGPAAKQLSRGELPPTAAAWENVTRGSSLRRLSFERLQQNVRQVDLERAALNDGDHR